MTPVYALQLLLRNAPVDLVQQMLYKSIMGDWDVICCMDASALNGVLKTHYEEQLELFRKDPKGHDAGNYGGLYSSIIEIYHSFPWIRESRNQVPFAVPVHADLSCLACFALVGQGECVRVSFTKSTCSIYAHSIGCRRRACASSLTYSRCSILPQAVDYRLVRVLARVRIMSRCKSLELMVCPFCVQAAEKWSQRVIHYKLGPPFVQLPPNQPGYAIVRQEIMEGSRTVVVQVRKPRKQGAQSTDQEVGALLRIRRIFTET